MRARRFLVFLLFVIILTNAIYLFFEYRKMQAETKYWKLKQAYLIELIEQEKKGGQNE
jgi:hypothetical protein